MLKRVLEPETMDTPAEAAAYDAMDHRAVNGAFARDALTLHPHARTVLDVGAGTGLIAIVLASKAPHARVTSVDLAGHMLARAAQNVARAGLLERIGLAQVDAKALPYREGDFELIVCNSVVHHVPEPVRLFAELARVAGARGAIFVRDLARPESEAELARLVATHAANETEEARELFRASLHASLTPDEVREVAARAGLSRFTVETTSDRHWTLARLPA